MRSSRQLNVAIGLICVSVFAMPAIAQNGRPAPINHNGPPSSGQQPIKIGKPAPASPSPKPIRIGEPSSSTSNAGDSPKNKDTVDATYDWILKQPLEPEWFTWEVGQGPIELPAVATHLCVLTGVSGKFAGGGEKVQLVIDQGAVGGPRWRLNGQSGQPALRAAATCVKREKFVPMAEHPNKVQVHAFSERMFSECPPDTGLLSTAPYAREAAFLSTIGGKFAGGGEMLAVAVSAKSKSHVLRGEACSGAVIGAVTTFSDPEIAEVKYRTQTARTNSQRAATFVQRDDQAAPTWFDSLMGTGVPFTSAGTEDLWLTPVDEAVCGLVSIRGKLQGYGEEVSIRLASNNGKMWWKLGAQTLAQGSFLEVGVRCLARDQR